MALTLTWVLPPYGCNDTTAVAAFIGPAGGVVARIEGEAARALSGHRCVIPTDDGLDYPDLDEAAHGALILGITTGAAEEGATATVQTYGDLTDVSFSWTIGPVFCGANGELTQTVPVGVAFSRQVGVARAADTLMIDLGQTFLIAD